MPMSPPIDIGDVLRDVVVVRIAQRFAASATDDVGTDDAPARRQLAREEIEVAPDARQSMDADDDIGIRRVAPFGIRHRMEARRAQATDGGEARFDGHLLVAVDVEHSRSGALRGRWHTSST